MSQDRTSSIFLGAMHKFLGCWGVCLSIHKKLFFVESCCCCCLECVVVDVISLVFADLAFRLAAIVVD